MVGSEWKRKRAFWDRFRRHDSGFALNVKSHRKASIWYREPMVWLVIMIPFSAVIMGGILLTLAVWSDDGRERDHRYEISVSGIDGMELGLDADRIPVAAHEILSISARVRADPYSLTRASSTIVFTLQAIDDGRLRVEEEARFLGPVSPAR